MRCEQIGARGGSQLTFEKMKQPARPLRVSCAIGFAKSDERAYGHLPGRIAHIQRLVATLQRAANPSAEALGRLTRKEGEHGRVEVSWIVLVHHMRGIRDLDQFGMLQQFVQVIGQVPQE
jgi:hypothetical protein